MCHLGVLEYHFHCIVAQIPRIDPAVGGTATVTAPPQGLAETPPPKTRAAPRVTEAHGTTETQVQGGLAAVAGAEAKAQTEAVRRRSVSRVVLVGSRQQPPQMWLGTPTLLLLQVARRPPPRHFA